MKTYNFEVKEINIGVADDTRKIGVKASDIFKATKRLIKYLENSYEDKLLVTSFALPFNASMRRYGGVLKISKGVES